MQTILISGANEKQRETKARELVSENSSSFDQYFLDARETKGIDAVREVVKKAAKKPFESPLTSIVILEADKLTLEAQNSLLKILEEPPEQAQIILTSATAEKLLPTVTSRLSEINLTAETEHREEVFNIEEFKTKSLSEKLTEIENLDRKDFIAEWRNLLHKEVLESGPQAKSLHRYNKLLLKMQRAEKANVNKKLINLILALEIHNQK